MFHFMLMILTTVLCVALLCTGPHTYNVTVTSDCAIPLLYLPLGWVIFDKPTFPFIELLFFFKHQHLKDCFNQFGALLLVQLIILISFNQIFIQLIMCSNRILAT